MQCIVVEHRGRIKLFDPTGKIRIGSDPKDDFHVGAAGVMPGHLVLLQVEESSCWEGHAYTDGKTFIEGLAAKRFAIYPGTEVVTHLGTHSETVRIRLVTASDEAAMVAVAARTVARWQA